MSARLRLTTPAAARAALLDVLDLESRNGTNGRAVFIGGSAGGQSQLFTATSGAPTVLPDALTGLMGYRMVSAVNSIVGMQAQPYVVPLGRRWATLPDDARAPRRYVAEAVLRRDALIAGVPMHFGLKAGSPSPYALSQYANIWGVELISDPALNGGNWTARAKLAPGTLATTDATDSGVAGTEAVHVRIVYDERDIAAPVLALELDGARLLVCSGFAALPQTPTGTAATDAHVPMFGAGANPGSAAGCTDWVLAPRFQLWEAV